MHNCIPLCHPWIRTHVIKISQFPSVVCVHLGETMIFLYTQVFVSYRMAKSLRYDYLNSKFIKYSVHSKFIWMDIIPEAVQYTSAVNQDEFPEISILYELYHAFFISNPNFQNMCICSFNCGPKVVPQYRRELSCLIWMHLKKNFTNDDDIMYYRIERTEKSRAKLHPRW